jgi:hypothetical protein
LQGHEKRVVGMETNQNRYAVAKEDQKMESFKSKQFMPKDNSPVKPSLNSHTRKLYPELTSFLNFQIKQEQLHKLQIENQKLDPL